ncbi:MAG: FAD-dependent oxidoreductase, partial [Ignavibacteria bacterium]|nr:FAD-dependent oxidoreductase [Ignavibacteria bacterium]
MADFEITVIGAGVIGLAIAARLSERHPSVLVVEKNRKYGMETSSRNSEVIHAGIYYTPGSLRAKLCVEGRDELYNLCLKHSLPHKQITKLITATSENEVEKLNDVFQNGLRNGVRLEMLDREATLRLEPNINTIGSLFSPLTGILSAHELMDFFYQTAKDNGVTVQHRCEVIGIEPARNGYTITIDELGLRWSFSS